jgi:patatin-like phospholipase/acyl hydrolase
MYLFGPGPKRILSIDGGGGVRGVVSLAFLERMEALLRAKTAGGDPDFRLSDHFDLIGGTSTGALIAAGLAMGFSVAPIQPSTL